MNHHQQSEVESLTYTEYMERLTNLLPPGAVTTDKLTIDSPMIIGAANRIGELCYATLAKLRELPDTDYNHDLRQKIRDIWTLGGFLNLCLIKAFEE